MFTSSAVMSTLASSSEPDCKAPRLDDLGHAHRGLSRLRGLTQELAPMLARPCRLAKLASTTWPEARLWPFRSGQHHAIGRDDRPVTRPGQSASSLAELAHAESRGELRAARHVRGSPG